MIMIRNLVLYPTRYPTGIPVGFSPRSISSLLLWLKADTGTWQDSGKTTPAVSDGDVIGAWVDLSGNGNDTLQTTTANKPLLKLNIVNGKPVIRFDGSDDFLSVALDLNLSASDDLTIFLVTKPVDNAATKNIMGNYKNSGDSQGLRLRYSSIEKLEFITRKDAVTITQLRATDPDSTFALGVGQLDSGTQKLYKNGTLQNSASQSDMTGNNTNVFVGKIRESDTNEYAGDIAEMLIYDSALSNDDRGTIEDYLNGRYAIF